MNVFKSRIGIIAASIWLLLTLALTVHQIQFWRSNNLDSDVMALLPNHLANALETKANDNMAKLAARQVVVLIGSQDAEISKAAAAVFHQRIEQSQSSLILQASTDEDVQAALDFYSTQRQYLLTAAQKRALQNSDKSNLQQSSMERLYHLDGSGGLSSWISDPLGLSLDWWQERIGQGITQEDGYLLAESQEKTWVVLRYQRVSSAFQLDGVAHLQVLIQQAGDDAKKMHPNIEIINAGVPLHAEAAAVRANWEINTIGYGSLAVVMLLVFFAFMKARPIILVAASLLIGCAAGISLTALIFGKVHLLTLVFGASLVGVAEDYGIHYFSSRQGKPEMSAFATMQHLMPGLLLALITSALAYLSLGMAPLPGLQQMAVFSAAGLCAAFLTVVCWFPYLDRQAPKNSWLSEKISNSLRAWPCFDWQRTSHKFIALFALVFICVGLSQLKPEDSLRQLQSSPQSLLLQEKKIAMILGLPSPAQYILVTSSSQQGLLQAEENLKVSLDTLREKNVIDSYSAISDWVPSRKQQTENKALVLAAEKQVLQAVAESLGESFNINENPGKGFDIEDWQKLKVSQSIQMQYLGEVNGQWGSVVMLNGLSSQAALATLKQSTTHIPNVTFIDRSAEISDLLKQYRGNMTVMLLMGYVLVAGALYWRFKNRAWRALLPTLLAALLSVSALAWLGEPLQLFTVLAQFLLLGMGVDYGIFLLEHHQEPYSWLAVCLGAASTLLAFGLLALSATPALHTFGLSMLFGVGLSWLLSPCFRYQAQDDGNMSLQN